MKFYTLKLSVLVSLASQCALAANNVAVYRFGSEQQEQVKEIPLISQKDSMLNLADDFGLSPYYKIEDVDDFDALSIGKEASSTDNEEQQKLILIINGVDEPSDFFLEENESPIFLIDTKDDRSTSLFKSFLSEVPSKLMSLNHLKLSQLSDEINILSTKSNPALVKLWTKYFQNEESVKLENVWSDLKNSFTLSREEEVKHVTKRSVNLISDEEFINELAQLDFFLKEHLLHTKDRVIINLDSLITIFKKTGANSQTYSTCKKLLSNLIAKHLKYQDNVSPTIVVLPIEQQTLTLKFREEQRQQQSLAKRSSGAEVFKRASTKNCYTSQSDCSSDTNSCSGHGVCSKFGSCFKCSCSSTKSNDTGRTTYWAGKQCEKEDVSAPFNLLFWSTLAIIFAFVWGVQLLVRVGSEELPGVLQAATVKTNKKNP